MKMPCLGRPYHEDSSPDEKEEEEEEEPEAEQEEDKEIMFKFQMFGLKHKVFCVN